MYSQQKSTSTAERSSPGILTRLAKGLLFLFVTCSIFNYSLLGHSQSIQSETEQHFSISAPSISAALLQFSAQSGVQLIMQEAETQQGQQREFFGTASHHQVLERLLTGSNLEYEFTSENTLVVRKKMGAYSDAESRAAGQRKPVLEELIISAQKRDQDLMKVPLHVQFLSKEEVDSAHISRVEEISNLSLSVTFSQKRGYDQSSLRIRGIGTQVLGAGVEPSVSAVIDGIVMARGGSQLNELPDIEHIEILNGPQGTLYGKNASVGLVNIITKAPNTKNREFSFSSQLTSDDDYSSKFGMSAPINDRLSYRVSGLFRKWDGNAFNRTTNNEVNGLDATHIRGKLQWIISDGTEILLAADYSHQDTECCARITRVDRLGLTVDPSFIGDPSPGGSIADVLGFPIFDTGDTIAQNRDPIQDSTNLGTSLKIDSSFYGHKLTSLTAIREWRSENSWDNDLLPLAFHEQQVSDRDTRWFTQEIRLTSPEEQALDYILGLYYYRSTTHAMELADRTFINANIDEVIFVNSTTGDENIAFFGHFDWQISDETSVFSGFRLLNNEVSATAFRGGRDLDGNGNLLIDFTTDEVSNSDSETVLVGKLGVQYDLTSNTLVYVSGSTGYKGGSFSVEFGFDPVALTTTEPVASERSRSYELGLKSTLLNQRLRTNLTAYHTRIDNLQIGLRDLDTIDDILGSVPETIARGVEFNFSGLLTENFIVNAGISYSQAFFSDFNNGLCYLGQAESQGCFNGSQNLTGQPLENAPKWKFLLNSRYERTITETGIQGHIQGNYRWQSEVFLSDDGDPGGLQGAFSVFDLSMGITSADKQLRASMFIKNLFNQHYASGVSANSADGGGVLVHTLPRDFNRYFGISFEYRTVN